MVLWWNISHQANLCSFKDNTKWQIDNGSLINFWINTWLIDPIVEIINIDINLYSLLRAEVSDCISDKA